MLQLLGSQHVKLGGKLTSGKSAIPTSRKKRLFGAFLRSEISFFDFEDFCEVSCGRPLTYSSSYSYKKTKEGK
jgi:hypothetical protein